MFTTRSGLARSAFLTTVVGAILAGIIACNGNTSGGSAGSEDFAGEQFVASDGTTGTFSVEVKDTNPNVSQTSGFFVRVRDVNGAPVENIAVSCDSETGVAILEPSNGTETTSSGGEISGTIGCAQPGSYLFGCRLPVGVSKRQFVTIRCDGPIPSGFTGFPGAGGGGLGGGNVIPPTVGESRAVRIQSIGLIDSGDLSGSNVTASVDVLQGTCESGDAAATPGAGTPAPTPSTTTEPFFDTYIKVKVQNNTNQIITFNSFSYTVGDVQSGSIGFLGTNEVGPNGAEVELLTVFANASGGRKTFLGQASPIPTTQGFSNITIQLQGTNDLGENVVLEGTSVGSFGNFNRCDN